MNTSNQNGGSTGVGWFGGLFNKRDQRPRHLVERRNSTGDYCNDNDNDVKKEQQPRRRRASMMAAPENEYTRRPSIPTSIHQQCISNLDQYLDESMRGDDDDENENDSIVSEVTMLTYTDEKANFIKEEFFSRTFAKELTLQEKKAILMVLQQEAARKFAKRRCSDSGDDIQERMRQMEEEEAKKKEIMQAKHKANRRRRVSQHSNIDWDIDSSEADRSGGGSKVVRDVSMTKEATDCSDGMKEEQPQNYQQQRQGSDSWLGGKQKCCQNQHHPQSKQRGAARTNGFMNSLTESFSGSATMKRINALQSEITDVWDRRRNSILEDEEGPDDKTDATAAASPQHYHQQEEARAPPRSSLLHQTDAASISPNIDDIIELKLLVANQQATIDTISSKLHNAQLTLSNRHQVQLNQDQNTKITRLENENVALKKQLSIRQERERMLRKQILDLDKSDRCGRRDSVTTAGRRDSFVTASTTYSGSSTSRTL